MWRLFLFLMTLACCNAPGPHFSGVAPVRISVDGSVFDVRVRGRLAEAIRVNPQYAPRFGPVETRAAFVMAEVSGCEVQEVRGDQAVALGILACDGARGPPLRVPASYSCFGVRQRAAGDLRGGYLDFECEPI